MRAATDSAGTLDNRLIIVTGFTMAGDGGTDLGRVVITAVPPRRNAPPAYICLAQPHRRGEIPRDTWLRIEGTSRNRKFDGCKLFRPEDARR